ncbi:MAG TPA: DUF262 domain-containing protein [Anaerolineae bacterium]|nr:DUF262 domain-containing protein [Anaerolineae bacterium]HQH38048.1 DUF262 domain-containing protein [Anaerolineae bacterium]
MKINQLVDDIRIHDLVLPEFQREYVWSRDQAKQLIVSLMKNYPIGSLLFWKTNDPPELKNLDVLPEKLGAIHIILDGQQRLTTLYMLVTGEVPPYYTSKDITTDPRDLYFNLDDGDFQYYQASRMQGNSLWRSVVECFAGTEINVFQIAKQQATDDAQAFANAQRYIDNLNRLRQIREMDVPVQTVPVHATIDESIDIFDRVNSQGTKLTDAELALTHITGKWPHARREMKVKVADMATRNFYFDLTFMTRALTGVVTKRALFEQIHKQLKEELLQGWGQLTQVLDYLTAMLPGHAKIHSTEDVNTTNAFVPIIVYLSLHDARFPDQASLNQAIHWLYAALMWSRYTAQTDQRLEQDVSLVVRHDNPWQILCEQIVDQRGRIEVKASDLEGRWTQHPLYRMTYVIAKTQGAVDWFNGVPLGVTHGKTYRLYSHHVFPADILYQRNFDADNHLHRKSVNEIANRAFLTADLPLELYNTCPEEYFPQVEDKYPGALSKQFIPMQPDLWKVHRYSDFLQARRELIARKINGYMSTLVTEPVVMHERPIAELIKLGESATLEFKSTLQWDVVQGKQNTELRFSVLKTIAAFLNSAGGTLIIGVDDSGGIVGLRRDLQLVKEKSLDGFEQLLTSLIGAHIGLEFARLLKIRFEELNGERICAVDVENSPEPAFVDSPRGKEFFIRHGNTTHALDTEEAHRYIQMNWE